MVLALPDRTIVEKIQVLLQLHIKSLSSEKNIQSVCKSQSLSLSAFWLLYNFHFLTITQIMGHPWATTTALEIWLGDVPKGEVDLFFLFFSMTACLIN